MDIFDQLKTVASDHGTLWDAFRASEQAAQDVTAAVDERIRRDKQAHAEMVATLTAQSRDPARPEIVRRLAAQELERLKDRKIGPTKDELAAFNSAMKDAEIALDDPMKIEGKLQGVFEEATATLKKMRTETLGNSSHDPDLARNWIEGDKKRFGTICMEAEA